MAERKIHPFLKSALELGPPILFFLAYTRFQDRSLEWNGITYDGFILVTLAFVVANRRVRPDAGLYGRSGDCLWWADILVQ